MADSIQKLRLDLDRAMVRLAAMEDLIFRLDPSQVTDAIDTMEAIRLFLRKSGSPEYLSEGAARFIAERLPVDWRDLVKRAGHQVVFPLLARGCSIIDARRALG
jgi:hypothetical protein